MDKPNKRKVNGKKVTQKGSNLINSKDLERNLREEISLEFINEIKKKNK